MFSADQISRFRRSAPLTTVRGISLPVKGVVCRLAGNTIVLIGGFKFIAWCLFRSVKRLAYRRSPGLAPDSTVTHYLALESSFRLSVTTKHLPYMSHNVDASLIGGLFVLII